MTLSLALAEIRRRAPLLLNATQRQTVEGVERDVGFADDHLFAVELPGWVLRAVVEAAGEGEITK